MVMFWVYAGTLTVAVLSSVLLPLFRRSDRGTDRASHCVLMFHHQLAEIERDVEQGFLSTEQAAAVGFEIKRRLLAAIDSGEEDLPGIGRFLHRSTLAGIALAVPAGILSLYLALGIPWLPDNPLAGRTDELKRASEQKHIASMVDKLLARLKENPQDVDGWLLLGHTYKALGRTRESVDAHARAYALKPEGSGIAIGYGEALVHAGRGYVSEAARTIIEKALMVNPEDFQGRYLLGLAKTQTDEELPEAVEVWAAIEKDSPPGAPWLAGLREQIERARKRLRNADAVIKTP